MKPYSDSFKFNIFIARCLGISFSVDTVYMVRSQF